MVISSAGYGLFKCTAATRAPEGRLDIMANDKIVPPVKALRGSDQFPFTYEQQEHEA